MAGLGAEMWVLTAISEVSEFFKQILISSHRPQAISSFPWLRGGGNDREGWKNSAPRVTVAARQNRHPVDAIRPLVAPRLQPVSGVSGLRGGLGQNPGFRFPG